MTCYAYDSRVSAAYTDRATGEQSTSELAEWASTQNSVVPCNPLSSLLLIGIQGLLCKRHHRRKCPGESCRPLARMLLPRWASDLTHYSIVDPSFKPQLLGLTVRFSRHPAVQSSYRSRAKLDSEPHTQSQSCCGQFPSNWVLH